MTALLFGVLLIVTVTVWAVTDVLLWIEGGVEATYSRLLLAAARQWPVLPFLAGFALGVLVGHLTWPQP